MNLSRLLPLFAVAALAGPVLAQGSALLDQPFLTHNYTFSGQGSFSQVLAEAFQVGAAGYDLGEVTVWGVYWTSNVPPASDQMTINIYQDVSGLPAAAPMHTWTNPTLTRTNTGVQTTTFQVLDIFEYEVVLPNAVNLAQGSYWMEIYNLTSNGDIWAIPPGMDDPNNGMPGFA